MRAAGARDRQTVVELQGREEVGLLPVLGPSDTTGVYRLGATIDNTGGPTNTSPSLPSYTYAPANPYNDAYSNSLADVAMYYWKNDLRGTLTNNVPTDATDPAFWQHLVNYTVGFGVTGTISSAAINSAFTATPQTITLSLIHI